MIDKQNPDVSQATIGDLVQYNILVTLPEGQTPALVVTDNVPAGMSMESATILTSGAPITNGTFSGTLNAPTISPALPSGSGAAFPVTFNFGTATVTSTTGTTANQFVIHVTMRVLDVLGNQIAFPGLYATTTTFANTAKLDYNAGASATPTTVNDVVAPTLVKVKEPLLTIAKTIKTAASPADAGGVVTYQIVLTNPTLAVNADGADAYQVVLTDTVPAGLLITGVTADTKTNGTGTTVITSTSAITGGGTGLTGTYFIPVGGTVTVVYSATIQDTAVASQTITNAADVKWNSQPSGTNGRDGTGGGVLNTLNVVNDYDLKSSASFTTTGPLIDKQNPDVSQATIGDLVQYNILVTLPEGVTQTLIVTDNVPAGMSLESATIVKTGSPLFTNGDFAGTLAAPTISPALPSGSGAAFPVTFSFGSPSVPGTPTDTGNQFVIHVTLRVLNVLGNQIAFPGLYATTTTFANTAKLTYLAGTAMTLTTVNDVVAPTLVKVKEPLLTIAKTIKTAASPADAGGVVT